MWAVDDYLCGLDVPIFFRPFLIIFFFSYVLLHDVDVGTILLRSHVRLDDMDVLLLHHVPNHDAGDDLDVDPNVVLNISDVAPDLDVTNMIADASRKMAGSEVAHRCRFRGHH